MINKKSLANLKSYQKGEIRAKTNGYKGGKSSRNNKKKNSTDEKKI